MGLYRYSLKILVWPVATLLPTLAASALADEPTRTTHQEIKSDLQAADLSMEFSGEGLHDFQQWHNQFSERLSGLLGDSTPPELWSVDIKERVLLEDHERIQITLKSDSAPELPIYLLLPRNQGAPGPAVLCVHGHGDFGYHPIVGNTAIEGVAESIAKSNYDYGLQFVRRGYVVAAPCMKPFGPRVDRPRYSKQDPCAVTFVRMQALGKLLLAENLRDLRWAISFLQSRPEVDGDRIGCAGLSYGGRMTMMVAAVDSRVRVAAVSGALNLLQERASLRYSCGAQIIPGLLKYGDFSEIGSLIAPRPCVWETGSTDGLIVPRWDEIFRARLRKAYEAAAAPGNLHFDRFEGGHRWNGTVAYRLFEKHLLSSNGE